MKKTKELIENIFNDKIKNELISYLRESGSDKEPFLDIDDNIDVALIEISLSGFDLTVHDRRNLKQLDAKCDEYAQQMLKIVKAVIDENEIKYNDIRTKGIYPNPIFINIFY